MSEARARFGFLRPARHCERRLLSRGMKPIETVCMTQYMTSWKSTLKPQKTKAELYEMLAEAARNTAQPEPKPKRPPKAKRDRGKRAA